MDYKSHTTEQWLHWPDRTFPGGWSEQPPLNSPPFSHLFAWLYGLGREKASGFEDLVKTQKGVCAQTQHNKMMWMRVCLCVWISAPVWSPPLHSGNYFYQGLDEGEGKEERERWKDVKAEKGGSRFRERTEKWEKQREEKRDWGLCYSECFSSL